MTLSKFKKATLCLLVSAHCGAVMAENRSSEVKIDISNFQETLISDTTETPDVTDDFESIISQANPDDEISGTINADEMTALHIDNKTPFEVYLEDNDYTSAINLIDHDMAVKSFISELSEARGMALGIKSQIASRMGNFDEKQVLIARIFDTIAIELQTAAAAVRSPSFDAVSAIHRELSFSSDTDNCSITKELYKSKLSLVYTCGKSSNGYLINLDPDDYKVVAISSEQFGGINEYLESIIEDFYGSTF
ncbi:exported hypothetical protein [Vibrio chagasii]|nr:exported hypothetical protein [Vibrio chagasii]